MLSDFIQDCYVFREQSKYFITSASVVGKILKFNYSHCRKETEGFYLSPVLPPFLSPSSGLLGGVRAAPRGSWMLY